MTRPARAMPPDFPERFVELGWEGAPEHFGAHSRMVARWLDKAGRDELRRRRKNYVLGNRLGRGVSSLKLRPDAV